MSEKFSQFKNETFTNFLEHSTFQFFLNVPEDLNNVYKFFGNPVTPDIEEEILSIFRELGFDNRIQCEKKCHYGSSSMESQISLMCENGRLKEIVLETPNLVLEQEIIKKIKKDSKLQLKIENNLKPTRLIITANKSYSDLSQAD